jgi:hypothetical protein
LNDGEKGFFHVLSDGQLVGLWGAGGIFYKLINNYHKLHEDRFLLIDKNKSLHGLMLCEKKIYSPEEVLPRVETVIIMALSRKEDIYTELRENYPNVQDILVPGVDIVSDGFVPVLKSY